MVYIQYIKNIKKRSHKQMNASATQKLLNLLKKSKSLTDEEAIDFLDLLEMQREDLVSKQDLHLTKIELESKMDKSKSELEAKMDKNKSELEAKIDQNKKDLEQTEERLNSKINTIRIALESKIDKTRIALESKMELITKDFSIQK